MEESDRTQLNAAASGVLVLGTKYEGLASRFEDMYRRLYNGGTGDITKIIDRLGELTASIARWMGSGNAGRASK